jgi:hypothetical protein
MYAEIGSNYFSENEYPLIALFLSNNDLFG